MWDEIQRFHAAESRDQACLGYAEAKKRSDEIQRIKTRERFFIFPNRIKEPSPDFLHKKMFQELTTDELYELLSVGSEVFVVEQNCVYQDLDNDE